MKRRSAAGARRACIRFHAARGRSKGEREARRSAPVAGQSPARRSAVAAKLARLWLFLGAVAMGHAHDAFEITTLARFRADGLELVVTMAPSTALRLNSPDAKPAPFDPAQFERVRGRFAALGAELFRITCAGKRVAARNVTVELGRELDIEFHIRYPVPPGPRVDFTAPHLARLGDGYGNVLTVHDRGGELLGQELLVSSAPTLAVTASVPAAIAVPRRPWWTRWRDLLP